MAHERNEIDIDVDVEEDNEADIDEEVKKELETKSVAGSSDVQSRHKSKKVSSRQVPALNQIHSPRLWKNSRRSRNGYGRGLPKKKGAGGKGVWGLPGSELFEADEDINDPNYDNENMNNGAYLHVVNPDEPNIELKKQLEPVILEYFEHGESGEVSKSVLKIVPPGRRNVIVERSIEIAMDHKTSHRELTSILIADLSNDCINEQAITKAFENILADIDDLVLDIPDAPILIGNFIARAIADECIPPKFIDQTLEKSDGERFQTALKHAKVLINMEHGLSRLHNVWGFGGALRPVKSITKRMILDLKEYIYSRDIEEAARCLKQLEVPHFHHEFVYEAIIMALEANKEDTEEAICQLLSSFAREVLITKDEMERGFKRIYNDLPDIEKDVPRAYFILERFVNRCSKARCLSEAIIQAMPSRGRKRYVSEGDQYTKGSQLKGGLEEDKNSKVNEE
ncbi:programmed cell death protein 4 [Coccinella septempunctata]|uniref:programmed cell death protein 4 n=1 Tax=Coccinella septempunctata TaxID=41139 RepID=UPI001D06D7C7|nr:programmed cell death protein 4 [Coccinella septempunctata]XP_044756866.1 programmed cell death protein 4 [Coccinella septempunctata]